MLKIVENGIDITTSRLYNINMNNNFTPTAIKALRDSLKLTQSKFAQRLKIDVITVSRWERGTQRPTIVAIRKLHRLQRTTNNA